jgi:DNA-binding winged helix-turn-helix (wHTH) protein/tetratricopeptide (TPR) repeat protein
VTVLRFGDYRIDAATRELTHGGDTVALPPRAFDCLLFLIEQRERAVGREELIAAMWGTRGATDVQLAQLVLQCRRAVGDDGQAQHAIRTVPGFGYRWIAPVRDAAPQECAEAHAGPRMGEPHASVCFEGHPAASPAAHAAHGTRHRLRFSARALTAIVVVAGAAAAVGIALRQGPPKFAASEATRVLVAPVRVEGAHARWLRLGGMDVVVERLRANRVPVLPSDATVALLHADGANETPDAIAKRARDAGAGTIVILDARHDGALWRVSATILHDNRERREQVDDADPLVALRQIADVVSGGFGYAAAEPMRRSDDPAVALTLQQARAALLANDVDGARTLLVSNPALVADEPLLQQQLAAVDIRAGRYAAAGKALDALLARHDGTPAFRTALFNARGLVAIRSGRFKDAGEDFAAALALLRADADPIALGRSYLGRGISRTSLQDYGGAQADYARAREAFERAGDPGSVARVDSDLGALENLRGHPAQAAIYLERARERFAQLGLIQEEINALQLLYVARRSMLAGTQAAAAIDRAWQLRNRIVSPSSLLSTGLYRVDSFLNRGRLAEADALIAQLAANGRAAAAAENDRFALMRAALFAAEGRSREALAALEGVPEAPHASADDDTVRAAVGVLRARLERRLGRPGDQSADPGGDISPPTPRTPLRELAAANRAWARGDTAAADRAFAAALALADTQGIAQTLAAIVVDEVEFLIATGRASDASAVAGRVALWAETDFDCALATLRAAAARDDHAAARESLSNVRRLAGERRIPPELVASAN